MYVLWNNILLPLLLVLAVLIVLAVILIVFSLIETIIFSKLEELKVRRTMHKVVKDNCKELKVNIDNIFDGMIDEFMLGKKAADEEFEKIKKSKKKNKGGSNE